MMDDSAVRKALLKLAYQAVYVVAVRRGNHDTNEMAEIAEATVNKIEEYGKSDPNSIVLIKTDDIDTYEYLVDIFDELEKTLPGIMPHFDVSLTINRLKKKENHDAAATHSNQGGQA